MSITLSYKQLQFLSRYIIPYFGNGYEVVFNHWGRAGDIKMAVYKDTALEPTKIFYVSPEGIRVKND